MRRREEVNKEYLEKSAEYFLGAFGKGNQVGTRETPRRFAEVFLEGDGVQDPEGILREAVIEDKEFGGMIVENGLTFFCICEHHLLPFLGEASIAYIPNKKLVGLSKLPRVLRCISNGPNLQEEVTRRVADVIEKVLEPKGVAIVIDAMHLCMVARGVRIDNCRTVTSDLRGIFKEPGSAARAEFLELRKRTK